MGCLLALLSPFMKFGLPFTRVMLQQLQEQHCLFLPVHGVFLCVQTMVWLPVFGIFNVCTGFDAGSGTQELCTNAVGESALIVDAVRKKICFCTWDSNPCRHCACPFSLMLYQLSCPTPWPEPSPAFCASQSHTWRKMVVFCRLSDTDRVNKVCLDCPNITLVVDRV